MIVNAWNSSWRFTVDGWVGHRGSNVDGWDGIVGGFSVDGWVGHRDSCVNGWDSSGAQVLISGLFTGGLARKCLQYSK